MYAEAETIEKAKTGDGIAFEEIVSKYEKQVYAMGLRYTGNRQDALDISQEVFLRVFRFLDKFDARSSFSTWIYRIASNVCKDTVAKKKKVLEIPLEADSDEGEYDIDIPDFAYSPEEVLESREARDTIAAAIAELPEKYRSIIIMREISGMSYEDIGRALDIEQGTVKSRISRARDKLRIILEKRGNIL